MVSEPPSTGRLLPAWGGGGWSGYEWA